MIKIRAIVKKGSNLYLKYERSPWNGIIAAVSFISGFALETLNPSRIDILWNNYTLLAYIVLAGIAITLVNSIQNGFFDGTRLKRKKRWLILVEHFCIGGLFSNQLIYYFQSSSGVRCFFFITLLLVMVILSEYFKNKIDQIHMQFAVFFLACFSFFSFFLPILTKEMNPATFLKSGALSLFFVTFILSLSSIRKTAKKPKPFLKTLGIVVLLFVILNVMYFMNWIPPVPLSLKHAGVYHHVSRQNDGYVLTYEDSDEYAFWNTKDRIFHFVPGDTVFCFASVFAPTALNKKIFHRWEQFIPEKNEWVMQDRVGYQLYGGRDGGFRGYTAKAIITPGEWHIDIITEDDLLLGTVFFEVKSAAKREGDFKQIKR